MARRIFCKVLLVIVAIFGLLVLSGVLSAQGNSDWAFEHVKDVQERNANRLMAMDDVEGTAIGYNQNDRLAIKVFTAGPGVRGIPQTLDGVPVHVVVTGKFYALAKPQKTPPGQAKKVPPPPAPTDLEAEVLDETSIRLSWNHSDESVVAYYNVYRSDVGLDNPIGSPEQSPYDDEGLQLGTPYGYVVTAVGLTGKESDYSNESWATTAGEPPVVVVRDGWCSRPVPIGVSTGHPDITAGTIGCRVIGDGGKLYALSNNHVYANSNNATIDVDMVLQPGRVDGGVDPVDAIGTLAGFQEIYFGSLNTNTIDAAIAEIIIDDVGGVDTPRVGNATPKDGYSEPMVTTIEAQSGQLVQKYGRTTGLTTGVVDSTSGYFKIRYGRGLFAYFVDQIVIKGTDGIAFSEGGDSGSLVVVKSSGGDDRKAVGLLFAGGGDYTIANPIDDVLKAFDVTIDGE